MNRAARRGSIALAAGVFAVFGTCASGWWTLDRTAAAESHAGVLAGTADRLDDDETRPSIDDLPQLTVRGEARLAKEADEVRLRVGVQSQAEDARQALEANSRLMRRVVAALTAAELTDDEYETGRFRIRPDYARRPRNAGNDWRPTIVGYTVSNSLLVKTGRLELIGDLIAAANDAGANDVSIDGFGLANPEQYRDEAIVAATRRARSDAATLAAAADLELVRILRIQVDAPNSAVVESGNAGMAAARMAADVAAPPIDGGDVTVNATVRIVYEVRDRDEPDLKAGTPRLRVVRAEGP